MNKMQWPAFLLVATLLPVLSFGQNTDSVSVIKKQAYEKQGGNFSIGVRTNLNTFTDAPKVIGGGMGGSFRIQLVDRVNTEWFADFISSDLYGKAHRADAHIGWYVMFYLLDPKGFTRKLTPFVAAGHCFDYTRITLNGEDAISKTKWSSAVQASLGCHYNITPQFDITLATMYVLHVGNDLDGDLEPDGSIALIEHKNAGFEGHVMVILSAHYKFCKLWKPKKSSHSFWS